MSANLITGNLFKPIYAYQDADYQAGISGNVTSIMPVGSQMALSIEDANTIKADDGVLITKEGRRIQIDAGAIEEWSIPTGTQGQTNYYIVGFRLYTGDNSAELCETFVEKMENATDTIPEDTFRGGATEVHVSLGRVVQNGINLESVTSFLPVAQSFEDVKNAISQLNSDLGSKSSASAVTGNDAFSKIATLNSGKQTKLTNSLSLVYNNKTKLSLLANNEGGNILIYPPDSVTTVSKWEMDAYNGNLRVFVTLADNKNKFPLVVNKDGTVSIGQINNEVTLINTGSRANLNLTNSTHSGFVECSGSNLSLALYSGAFANVLNWLSIRPDYTEFAKQIWAKGIKNDAGWTHWYNGNILRGSIFCNYAGSDLTIMANENGGSLHLNCANNVRLESDNGTLVVSRNGTWQNIAAAAFNVNSSRKVKENIKDITEEEAKKILDVDIVSFDYIEEVGGTKNQYGVIAEDVEKIIPSVVTIPQDYDETSDDYLNTPSVDYSKFVPFLIKLCQTQQKQIDDLTKRIEILESK